MPGVNFIHNPPYLLELWWRGEAFYTMKIKSVCSSSLGGLHPCAVILRAFLSPPLPSGETESQLELGLDECPCPRGYVSSEVLPPERVRHEDVRAFLRPVESILGRFSYGHSPSHGAKTQETFLAFFLLSLLPSLFWLLSLRTCWSSRQEMHRWALRSVLRSC